MKLSPESRNCILFNEALSSWRGSNSFVKLSRESWIYNWFECEFFRSAAGQQYVREAFKQKAGLAIRSSTNLGSAAWQQYVS